MMRVSSIDIPAELPTRAIIDTSNCIQLICIVINCSLDTLPMRHHGSEYELQNLSHMAGITLMRNDIFLKS